MIDIIILVAKTFGLSPALLFGICQTESNLQNLTNHKDFGSASYGVCQVKLETAKMFDKQATVEQLLDPNYNITAAAQYIKWQATRYKTLECVIAAYNAGRCKVNEEGIINRRYVAKVRSAMSDYTGKLNRAKRNGKRHSPSITVVEAQWRTALDAYPPIGFRDFLNEKKHQYQLYSGDTK